MFLDVKNHMPAVAGMLNVELYKPFRIVQYASSKKNISDKKFCITKKDFLEYDTMSPADRDLLIFLLNGELGAEKVKLVPDKEPDNTAAFNKVCTSLFPAPKKPRTTKTA